MHPPGWVCRRLHQLHPQLRLAWAGRQRQHDDELNPGSFALVQLYHVQDTGRVDDPTTFRLLWDVDPVVGDDGETTMVKANRGPIFGKNGTTHRDWDNLSRVPVFVATLDESYGMGTEDVLSGKFLDSIRLWLTPIERRMRESAREAGRNLAGVIDDVSHEASSDLLKESHKSDAASVIMANKHAKDDMVKLEQRVEAQGAVEDSFELPPLDA